MLYLPLFRWKISGIFSSLAIVGNKILDSSQALGSESVICLFKREKYQKRGKGFQKLSIYFEWVTKDRAAPACPVLGMGAAPAGPLRGVERWELHLEGSMGHTVEDRQDLALSVPPGHWAALGECSLPAPALHSSAWVPPPTNRSQVHQEEQTKGRRRERSVKGSSYRQLQTTQRPGSRRHSPRPACSRRSAGSAARPRSQTPSSRSGTTRPSLWYILSGPGRGWRELQADSVWGRGPFPHTRPTSLASPASGALAFCGTLGWPLTSCMRHEPHSQGAALSHMSQGWEGLIYLVHRFPLTLFLNSIRQISPFNLYHLKFPWSNERNHKRKDWQV